MTTVLEITQLENGDIVLREADGQGNPLVSIRFSDEVKEMLGQDLVGVAEAMIDAATEFLGSAGTEEGAAEDGSATQSEAPPVIH